MEHIANVLRTIPSYVDRIYAIDDASSDATWEQMRTAAREINERTTDGSTIGLRRVIPIRHRTNKGAGGAVISGYEHALADGIDVIAVMDGDGQMDPADLDRIIDPVVRGEAAYAKGERLRQSTNRQSMSRWRVFGNWLLTALTRISSGYWEMSDPQNGYTAISHEALARIPLQDLYQQYGFLNHLLVHLNMNRERIADVPHVARYGTELSGIRYRTFVPGLSWLLLTAYIKRLIQQYLVRRLNPIVSYYPVGILSILIGIIGFGLTVSTPDVPTVGGVLLSGLFVLGGFHLLIEAMGHDVEENADLVEIYPPTRERTDWRPVVAAPQPVESFHGEMAGDGGEQLAKQE